MTSRWIYLSCFIAIVAVGWTSPTSKVVINEPAPKMAAGIKKFKQQFAARHAMKTVDEPVASILAEAHLVPKTVDDEKLLELTSSGKPRALHFSLDGSTVTSDGQRAPGILFSGILQNHTYDLAVDVPAHLQVLLNVKSDKDSISSITMTFSRSVVVHTDQLTWIPLLPHALYLESIAVSDSRVSYTFSDGQNAGSGEYVLNLNILPSTNGGAK